jgi:hypothetical protein
MEKIFRKTTERISVPPCGTQGLENDAGADPDDDPSQQSAQKLVINREGKVDEFYGSGKDEHPRHAVKEKPGAHKPPPKDEVRDVQNKVYAAKGKGRGKVMNDERQTRESAAQELPWDQDAVDGQGTKGASRGNEAEVPQHLRQEDDEVPGPFRDPPFDLPGHALQTPGLSLTGLVFEGL